MWWSARLCWLWQIFSHDECGDSVDEVDVCHVVDSDFGEKGGDEEEMVVAASELLSGKLISIMTRVNADDVDA